MYVFMLISAINLSFKKKGDFPNCFTMELIAIIYLFTCGLSSLQNICIASKEQKHHTQRQNKNSHYHFHHNSSLKYLQVIKMH
jgi:hypothetical protein